MPSEFRVQCPLRRLWLLTYHITNIILIFRSAGRIIWTWRLWKGRPSWRWAWLLFVLRLLWCILFILVAVQIHYDFSHFISRQHTSPFRMQNIATLHCQQNFSTANQSNSKISAKLKFCKLLGGIMQIRYNVPFPNLRTVTQLPVSNTQKFYYQNIPVQLLNARHN